jgi:acetyl esterase/lipase
MPGFLRSALPCAVLVSITMPPCAGVCAPKTAEAAKPHEGTLDTSVDTESMDASVRLKAMEQEQYGIEEYLYLVLFNQQHGERIAAERVTIPTVDAGTEPAYVFSPKAPKPGGPAAGLVMVHGSYHGSLDPMIFGFAAAAVDHGYTVIFPEYRGSGG